MSITSDLLAGLAQTIAGAGFGLYQPDAVFNPTDTAITTKNLPEHPDRVVVLTAYGSTDAPKENLSTFNVQARFRGLPNAPLDVDDLGDNVFTLLQGAESLWFGSVFVVQILRKSTLQVGADANQRWERTDNYAIDVNTPATPGRNY